ncbi:hypothetical protein H6G80_04800 [Nostoc sp. FACHB-87]|uniref:hypothetical protein n=1 Tax=Nostocales TaxID=1161 RepID=UPI001687A309|nr:MULTISPECIES: hypothetical protein [Nostocales]MBD2301453.1 hypothetical protein [Nostoc sp. FACHB-190]MBD2453391.1 hypothetical protein [Nostoc sp. FACHB-87]MBD2475516.1 hypothetical protein [Anabaena sp. FACHB-83]MBD2490287.1 hypothetical protein [Aulosira sp. FACHB-615]
MISQDYDVYAVDELLRKIRIKESQLKIAQASNLLYTSEALNHQILELRRQLSEAEDPEIKALMSLLED